MKRLTKSQYEVVATSLQKTLSICYQHKMNPQLVEAICFQMAKDLGEHDTEFDRAKFLQLCGITD